MTTKFERDSLERKRQRRCWGYKLHVLLYYFEVLFCISETVRDRHSQLVTERIINELSIELKSVILCDIEGYNG